MAPSVYIGGGMETIDRIMMGLLMLLGLIVFFCIGASYYRDIRMAELGYQEVTVIGHSDTVWHKVTQ